MLNARAVLWDFLHVTIFFTIHDSIWDFYLWILGLLKCMICEWNLPIPTQSIICLSWVIVITTDKTCLVSCYDQATMINPNSLRDPVCMIYELTNPTLSSIHLSWVIAITEHDSCLLWCYTPCYNFPINCRQILWFCCQTNISEEFMHIQLWLRRVHKQVSTVKSPHKSLSPQALTL